MRQFELKRTLLGAVIIAHVTVLDHGVHVLLTGGERTHVGAVSIADPQGILATQQFPAHKDGMVSEGWVRAISEAGYCPVAIVAGIHYNGLNRDQIGDVVKVTDEMLSELLHTLKTADSETAICS